jgi:hypothetical protein
MVTSELFEKLPEPPPPPHAVTSRPARWPWPGRERSERPESVHQILPCRQGQARVPRGVWNLGTPGEGNSQIGRIPRIEAPTGLWSDCGNLHLRPPSHAQRLRVGRADSLGWALRVAATATALSRGSSEIRGCMRARGATMNQAFRPVRCASGGSLRAKRTFARACDIRRRGSRGGSGSRRGRRAARPPADGRRASPSSVGRVQVEDHACCRRRPASSA